MATAAYAHGDAWVDALCRYLAGNAAALAEGVAAIPGLRPMPLDATYLAWVDFAGTGMAPDEFTARVERDARIAPSHGGTFGDGGDELPALQHRHAAGADRRGGAPPAGGVRRPAVAETACHMMRRPASRDCACDPPLSGG